MPDIETVFNFVNSCCVRVGNADERFESLVSSRKGKFMDSNGKVFIALRISAMILVGERFGLL